MRAVDGDDVHAREHLVEAVPIGGLERLLDLRRDPSPVVIVDLQAEGLGPLGHRLADAPHADDAEPLAEDTMAEHPGRRPALPFALGVLEHHRAFGQPPRHGEDQRHGHVGGVLGEHARRIGDDDAAVARGLEVDIVDAGAELGDQLQVRPGLAQHAAVDAVGHGRHQHVGGLGRLDQLLARERPVIEIEACVEQLAQPRLNDVGKLAGDDNDRSISHKWSSQDGGGEGLPARDRRL